jgi:hypothetical protein
MKGGDAGQGEWLKGSEMAATPLPSLAVAIPER